MGPCVHLYLLGWTLSPFGRLPSATPGAWCAGEPRGGCADRTTFRGTIREARPGATDGDSDTVREPLTDRTREEHKAALPGYSKEPPGRV